MPDGSISGNILVLSPRPARRSSQWRAALAHSVKAAVTTLWGAGPADGAAPCRAPSVIEGLEPRQLLSATYYVSTSGSDSNPGSLSAPFRTISHAAKVAGSGSTVDIMQGTYHETVTPNSGTTFQAYDGQKVEIDGADPISGWTKYSGNIYKASDPTNLGVGFNQVFVNNQMETEARWPYTNNLAHPTLAYATSGTTNSVTDPGILSSGVNWVGGTIHIAAGQQWVAQTATITAQSGDRLYFSLGPNVGKAGSPEAGSAFYLTGKLAALKSPGEWFYQSGTLYLWAPNGASPTGVEAKARQYGFNLNGKSNVTINDISLFACSIVANGSSNIKINGIHDTYVSQFTICIDGWQTGNSSGIVLNGNNDSIINSVIAYSAGDGILLIGRGDSAINNVIYGADYQAYDDAGIRTWGSGMTIDSNTIYDCGRDGIKWSGTTTTTIEHNLIYDVMLQTTDGGGIYTYGGNGAGSVLAYNKIYDISSGGWGAAGIYLDFASVNYSIHNNDVYACQIALKMNSSDFNDKIVSNTLIATQYSIGGSHPYDMSGSEFVDNVFNKSIQIGGSHLTVYGNVASGNTSGVTFAGSTISA